MNQDIKKVKGCWVCPLLDTEWGGCLHPESTDVEIPDWNKETDKIAENCPLKLADLLLTIQP